MLRADASQWTLLEEEPCHRSRKQESDTRGRVDESLSVPQVWEITQLERREEKGEVRDQKAVVD